MKDGFICVAAGTGGPGGGLRLAGLLAGALGTGLAALGAVAAASASLNGRPFEKATGRGSRALLLFFAFRGTASPLPASW